MHTRFAAIASSLLLAASSFAGPPEGRYTGVLRVTKWVEGIEVITTVKAAAEVKPSGALTIVLATAPSPIPESMEVRGTPKDVLRAQINGDDTCILPINLPAPIPMPESGYWAVVPIPQPVEQPKEQFRGVILTKGNTFKLHYSNTPISATMADSHGNFRIAVSTSSTRFEYTFRLKPR